MQKTLSDAQLRELLRSSATTYQQNQNELNTRERQAQKALDMMIDVMQPIAEYLTSLKVPAKVVRDAAGITFDVGEAPNASGQLVVKVTPDFKLAVIERSVAPGGNIGTHEQPARDPSDFGPPHWRAELARALTWMLGSGAEGHGSNHDDDDDQDEDEQ
jgi:hypothetical protein